LGIGTPKEFGVETDNVLQLEVYGLFSRIWQSLASAVVRLEDTKRLAVFTDYFAANSSYTSADLVCRGDKELTGGKLLHKDVAIGVISEALDPMGKSHDIAVTDSPNLNDLHGPSIHAYIRILKRVRRLAVAQSLKVMAGPTRQG